MKTMENKQTVVEWLQEALEHTILTHEQIMQTIGLFEQAKDMEKEQNNKTAVEFAKWLKHNDNGTEHYNPHTKETTESIGFGPIDCFLDNLMSEEELFSEFLKTRK